MDLDINTFYGVFAILLWSSTVALVRSITKRMNAFQAGAATFSLSGAICIVLFVLNRDFDSIALHPPRYLLVCGLLFIAYMVALFVAVERAKDTQQAMELGLINYLWPSLTVVLSLVLNNERVNLLLVPGLIISLYGVYTVVTQQSLFSWKSFKQNIRSNVIAYVAALIAAITWALYSNLSNLWAHPNAESAVYVFIPITGFIFILFSIFGFRDNWPTQAWDKRTILELLYFSVSTVLAYMFWDISMRRTNVSFVAILSYFTPFFSTLVVGFYHKESFSKKLWIGCILIIVGSLATWLSIVSL
jgi:drug/metabolite transporter (DMT)-like permease